MGCFDLSSFFLLRKKESSSAANSSSSKISKTEPLSPIADKSTLLTLAILQKIIVANQDTLSNFCSRICTSQCNCC
jgi:hypothetical protein